MEYIPPELREDVGELESKLPKLVEKSDINADLHIHSDFDIETSHDLGISSMEEIIKEVNTLNYKYLTFTEHNPSRSKHSKKKSWKYLK